MFSVSPRPVFIDADSTCHFHLRRPSPAVWPSRRFTLCTMVYSSHCTGYTVHCTLRVYSGQSTVHSVHCPVYSIQLTVCGVQCKVYSIHYKVNSVQCTVYSVQGTVYSVQCTLYSVQCTLYTVSTSGTCYRDRFLSPVSSPAHIVSTGSQTASR